MTRSNFAQTNRAGMFAKFTCAQALRLTEPRSDCDFVHGPSLHDRHQILGHSSRSVLLSRKMSAGSTGFFANSPRTERPDLESGLFRRFREGWCLLHRSCE